MAGLVVPDIVTWVALRSFLLAQADRRLGEAAEAVDHAMPPEGDVDADDLVAADDGGLLASGVYVERHAADGTITRFGGRAAVSPRLPDPLPVPAAIGPEVPRGELHETFRAPNAHPSGHDVLVRVQRSGDTGVIVIVAGPLDDVDAVLTRLLVVEAAVVVVVLALAAVAGRRLVGVGLRPLDDISRTAAGIAGGDLTLRVAHVDGQTEVGRLGVALNEMLHQIETAFDERARSEESVRRSEERLRRFVGDASHELRTPLAAVAAHAELAARVLDDDTGAAHHIDTIRSDCRRMDRLVDDLLLLGRLDQGRELEHLPVDVGLVAADAVGAARAIDPARTVGLDVDGLVEVRGDRGRLRQVVDNLVVNALAHTPARTPVEVVVGIGRGRDTARVDVVDHGPGIPAGEEERIFDRFVRLDASRQRDGAASDGGVRGSGLGLAIARAIVEAHGGALTVAPTPGGGATFTVTVPLLPDEDGPPEPV